MMEGAALDQEGAQNSQLRAIGQSHLSIELLASRGYARETGQERVHARCNNATLVRSPWQADRFRFGRWALTAGVIRRRRAYRLVFRGAHSRHVAMIGIASSGRHEDTVEGHRGCWHQKNQNARDQCNEFSSACHVQLHYAVNPIRLVNGAP